MRKGARLLAALLACGLLAGCGSSGLVPVSGRLTLDQRPLAGATVHLVAQDEKGRDARGITDADGNFQLATLAPGDGAAPGNYKVIIHYAEQVKIPEGLKTAEEVQAAMAEAAAKHVPTIVVPEIYTRPDQTPLMHKVPDDGNLTLELTTTPR
ncbi:MAG: hypothetical protein AB7K24_30795 [Gemmataceae bacterium]